jgi:hypothetical protein
MPSSSCTPTCLHVRSSHSSAAVLPALDAFLQQRGLQVCGCPFQHAPLPNLWRLSIMRAVLCCAVQT